MFNFLASKLSPKVTTKVAATDNYEVTNLIDENEFVRSRGFLAYSSIKPPADVDFELICPINVHYIDINAAVGNQKCTCIEILVGTSSSTFVSIAKASFQELDVTFCNSRVFSRSKPPPGFKQNSQLYFFKSNTFRAFLNAKFIKIRILQTDRSVPCLGKVAIWGKPSRQCTPTTIQTINRLMSETKPKTDNERIHSEKQLGRVPSDFEVPDEFKDALTYEIMANPMTLPSGSTVDRTTLEKYINNEASYGRQPSDPFTGLKFAADRKAVLNVALKNRIDMFLLQYADRPETFNLQRTVGTALKKSKAACELRRTFAVRGNRADYFNGVDDDDEGESGTKRKRNDDDLNELIKKAVNENGFVRFTLDEKANCTEDKGKCVDCKGSDFLYSLPCEHLFCRYCLGNVCVECKCSSCSRVFEKADVSRFHGYV